MEKREVSNRQIEIMKNMVAELVTYLVLFSVGYVFLTDLLGEMANAAELMLPVVFALFYYFLREKCRWLPLFLFLHGLPLAAVLLLYQGHLAVKVILFAMTLLLLVVSVVRRVTSNQWGMEAIPPPVGVGVFAVLYLLDQGQFEGKNSLFLLGMLFGFAAGYLVYLFLAQFVKYIDVNNRTTDHIPVNHVFYRAAVLAGCFIAGTVAVLFLGTGSDFLRRFGLWIRTGLIWCMNRLFALLFSGAVIEEDLSSDYSMGTSGGEMLLEPVEESLLMQILDVVVSLFAIAVALFLVAGFLRGVWKLIQNGFATRQRVQKAEADTLADVVENLDRRQKRERSKRNFLEQIGASLSPRESIRRIYLRTLLRAGERKVPISQGKRPEEKQQMLKKGTARECCRIVFEEQPEAAAAFAELYEKARYGREVCSREDVKRIKELANQLLGKS